MEYVVFFLFFFSLLGLLLPSRLTGMTSRVLDLGNVYAVIFIIFHGLILANAFISNNSLIKTDIVYSSESYFDAIYFLVSWILVFWCGYFFLKKKTVNKGRIVNFNKILHYSSQRNLKNIAFKFLVFELIVLFIYIYSTGGWDAFIFSHRDTVYAKQWDKSTDQMFENYIRIASLMIFLFGAVLGGLFQGLYYLEYKRHLLLFYLMMLPGMIVKFAIGSRGIFLFPVIFWLARILVTNRFGKKEIVWGVGLVTLLFFGMISVLYDRSELNDDVEFSLFVSLLIDTGLNGFTAFFMSKNIAGDLSVYEGFINVLYQLNPLPSFIISDQSYENNLTVLLHGVGKGSSVPMPFIGEAYYNLGIWSLTLAFMLGCWCAVVSNHLNDKKISRQNKFIWYLLFMASIVSFIYMPHSGLRATTRLVIWVGVASFIVVLSRKLIKKRHL